MTDHLPECEAYRDECGGGCICHHVRACEQRVLNLNPVALGVLIAQRARERALDAAREAVAALDPQCSGLCECLSDTLAAIDALQINNSPQQ